MVNKKRVGRPKGPKTVRHNIVLPVRTSKALRHWAKIVKRDVSQFVDTSVLLMANVLLYEVKKMKDDAK